MQGFGRRLERHDLNVSADQKAELAISMADGLWSVPASGHWVSGDVHVHMNYGGTHRDVPAPLVTQARAQGLDIIQSLIVNQEQRLPDIAFNRVEPGPAFHPPNP